MPVGWRGPRPRERAPDVWVSNSESGNHGQFEPSAAVRFPALTIVKDSLRRRWFTGSLVGRDACQPLMQARLIEIM